MATPEHDLDQRYYGPTIPPNDPAAGKDAKPVQRGLPCLAVADPYGLLCRAFRVLTLALIGVGIVVLVLWLAFQPDTLKATVDSANLTRFDLAASSIDGGTQTQTLRYNLTVALSVRNPNRRQAVVYRRLEAVALYGGEPFGYAWLPRMRQARKSTMVVRPSFDGQIVISPDVAGGAAAAFAREKAEGFFNVNVKLHARARLRVVIVNSVEYSPDVDCYIRVPDPGNATAVAQGFAATGCHVDIFS
ncbi:NDR1/HIN1-like protein 3 [Brachypodium distachyon]|uniref:Late embryogenesis abundant protein LEA-2 subgroup domain-containing protein n=1 Tax=Brachypodium distachyon TaxID=15368 RepID=I1HTP6_BRADI|nr:NDR1/HIN1-like protein 3 [Brachypodium distachyon]KQK10745.1 hypothetical protein BRADI_2g55910v3 [Brachypodium distachyon]|eukprot:XP_003567305.1 NDR1/HIN1-like protein 3 [Brachypodium distachyon]